MSCLCHLYFSVSDLIYLGRASQQELQSLHVHRSGIKQAVTLHTSLGDLKIEVFCEEVPRSAENFLALCASGYYNETIFHRNIRGFMIQGGDPTGVHHPRLYGL